MLPPLQLIIGFTVLWGGGGGGGLLLPPLQLIIGFTVLLEGGRRGVAPVATSPAYYWFYCSLGWVGRG